MNGAVMLESKGRRQRERQHTDICMHWLYSVKAAGGVGQVEYRSEDDMQIRDSNHPPYASLGSEGLGAWPAEEDHD